MLLIERVFREGRTGEQFPDAVNKLWAVFMAADGG